MKYPPNTLEFNHILSKNLKPIPVQHLQKILLRQHSGQIGSCASIYFKTSYLTWKMVGEHALAGVETCTSEVVIGHCDLHHLIIVDVKQM